MIQFDYLYTWNLAQANYVTFLGGGMSRLPLQKKFLFVGVPFFDQTRVVLLPPFNYSLSLPLLPSVHPSVWFPSDLLILASQLNNVNFHFPHPIFMSKWLDMPPSSPAVVLSSAEDSTTSHGRLLFSKWSLFRGVGAGRAAVAFSIPTCVSLMIYLKDGARIV